jgi:branched-chain amino acid transport system ATP-binding protein
MKSLLLRTITDEHRNIWQLGHAISDLAEEIEQGGRVDTRFFEAVFTYIDEYSNRAHNPREDELLFGLLRERDPSLGPLIDELAQEHLDGTPQIARLRAALVEAGSTVGRPVFVEELRQLVADIRSHIGKEEGKLLPRAHKVLTPEDVAALDATLENDEDPRFGLKAQAAFRELYHHVVNLAPESVGLGGSAAGQLVRGAANAPRDTLLAVRGVESHYGRIQALKGIDLEIRRGELVALVGANGAGKTTLLRTISGVQAATAGSVVFDGEDITATRPDLRVRMGICQVPEGRQVFGPLSIEDNLRLGAYALTRGQLAAGLDRAYETFPVLKEKRHLPAGTLSGGQQQMLAIGRALMGRPKLLLLDEPSMGLAPLLVEEVFNVVRSLKSQGMTIFLVEQNAYAALEIADRGYVMETGSIALTGTGRELLDNEQVKSAYLGI